MGTKETIHIPVTDLIVDRAKQGFDNSDSPEAREYWDAILVILEYHSEGELRTM